MAERPILRLGDPRLREVAARVTSFDTPELHELVAVSQRRRKEAVA